MTKIGLENDDNRHRFVRTALASIPRDTRILDAGAGESRYRSMCAHLTYVAHDFGEYVPHRNESGLHPDAWRTDHVDIRSDITSIPEPDGAFGAILCTEVLEHVPSPEHALDELTRLLAKDGILVVTAPFASLTHMAPFHFASGFSKFWYEHHLGARGFKIERIEANGNYFTFMAQEMRRVRDIAARYSTPLVGRAFDVVSRRAILPMLQTLASRDRGSEELLCYGFHVVARKT